MQMMDDWGLFLRLMVSPRIAATAVRVSFVVGTVLNAINQGEVLLSGDGLRWSHAALNYLVPFLVASFSGARALYAEACVMRGRTSTDTEAP